MPVAVTGKSLLTKKALDSALSALLGESSGEMGFPIGLTCSTEIFQGKMDTVFGQLDGLTGIAEDIFVYGKARMINTY